MLISFLNSHPNINAKGEILRVLNGKNYKNILDSVFKKEPFFIKAKGFKIFYYHPMDNKVCGLWDYLEKVHDLYVIHLKRKNILRTLLSRKIAGSTGEWITNSNKNNSIKKSVEFSIEELEEGFKQTRAWENEADKRFNNHPYLNVYYEDLVNAPEKEFRKITDFLELQYVHPQTNLKKQNAEKMHDLIDNYEDLKLAFKGTQWQLFFED